MGDPKRGDYMPPDESIDGEGAKFLVKGEELYEGEREERLEEELRHQIFKYDSNYIEDPNVVIDAIKRLTPEELNSPVVKDIVKRVVVQGCFSRGFTYEEMNKLVVGLKDLMPKAQTVELEPSTPETVKEIVRQRISRMRDIDRELQDACRNIVDTCRDLRYAVPDQLVDDCQRLEDAISRFRGMVRELLDTREYLDRLNDNNTQ